MNLYPLYSVSLACILTLLPACARSAPGFKAQRNIDYAGTGNPRQTLDLYLPEAPADKPRPLLVFIHGGGWEAGSKDDAGLVTQLATAGGYAAASVNYRLTDQAAWPAQIHDCKAAIRWLRANATEKGIDPERIAVIGISAGGHLVSMLGTTSGSGPKELEGDTGPHIGTPTRVSCVINFCGPANFQTFEGKGSIISAEKPGTAVTKLLGGTVSEKPEAAASASPVTHITADDPPFLHVHGTKDNLVPYTQAQEFDAALERAGISSTLLTGVDGPHVFYSAELVAHMSSFLARHLKGEQTTVPEGPVAIR